jgi:phosphate starvation-inducible PhoH-like protein
MNKVKYFLLMSLSMSTKIKPTIKSTALFYKPLTLNQKQYNNLLINDQKNIVIVNGPAGTGKTLMACNQAIQMLEANKINKIILTRPLITVENEEMGFLPGSVINKMDPWTRPIMDIFEKFYSLVHIQMMLTNKVIEICPLGFMRGRTFRDCFILADEMQNSSPNQMLMLTTRLGENCKMVVMGDIDQTDSKNKENGFQDIITKYKDYSFYNLNNTLALEYYELDKTDIVRSKVVTDILDIYQYKKPFDLKSAVRNSSFTSNKIKNDDAAMIPKTTYQDIYYNRFS